MKKKLYNYFNTFDYAIFFQFIDLLISKKIKANLRKKI
jgi:hypothetical protein